MDAKGRPSIFISYSHKDSHYLEEIRKYLDGNHFDLWSDVEIRPGAAWADEIEKALARCDAGLLFVSQDFLNSAFIVENELRALLSDAKTRGVRILWLALSASRYKKSEIHQYQALNDPERPLYSLTPEARKKELCEIAEKIERTLSEGSPKTMRLEGTSLPASPRITDERWRQSLLIFDYIQKHMPKRIDILQFGLIALPSLNLCECSFKCPDVRIRILLMEPDEAATRYSLGSQHKRDILQAVKRIKRIENEQSENPNRPSVGIWYYRTVPSLAAVIIDDDLLQLGWYFLHNDFDEPAHLHVSGHDSPALLAFGNDARVLLPKVRSHFNSVLAGIDKRPMLFGPRANELESEWRKLRQTKHR